MIHLSTDTSHITSDTQSNTTSDTVLTEQNESDTSSNSTQPLVLRKSSRNYTQPSYLQDYVCNSTQFFYPKTPH